jgi:hypothetical protein
VDSRSSLHSEAGPDAFGDWWDSLTPEEIGTSTKRGLCFAAWCSARRSRDREVTRLEALSLLLPGVRRLVYEVDRLIRRGDLGSRSEVADALLDLTDELAALPPSSVRSEVRQ